MIQSMPVSGKWQLLLIYGAHQASSTEKMLKDEEKMKTSDIPPPIQSISDLTGG